MPDLYKIRDIIENSLHKYIDFRLSEIEQTKNEYYPSRVYLSNDNENHDNTVVVDDE